MITIYHRYGAYTVLEYEHTTTMRKSGNRQYWTEYQVRRGNRIVARHDKRSEAEVDAQQRWEADKKASGQVWL